MKTYKPAQEPKKKYVENSFNHLENEVAFF